ncbi:gp70 [Sphingomonas phage PAU]|uniref:gp70 n=1 Tax=Sphingomonas phage PAU TaxID=1150991 RepID=UPI00025731D0|nr:gp70 [Sphingomonas phage PAU]AFF28068.1 gp70 [Sphingomonas phage PAU]
MKWTTLSMSDLWDFIHMHDIRTSEFIKPKFPTRRWGQSFTKTSTTCKHSVERISKQLNELRFDTKIVSDKEANVKFKNLGKFKSIQILTKDLRTFKNKILMFRLQKAANEIAKRGISPKVYADAINLHINNFDMESVNFPNYSPLKQFEFPKAIRVYAKLVPSEDITVNPNYKNDETN